MNELNTGWFFGKNSDGDLCAYRKDLKKQQQEKPISKKITADIPLDK